jgi:MYXO-CTERM domain-containing protein
MFITRKRLLPLMFAATCGLGLFTGAPEPADAFCGFYVAGADAALYNDATMVVLMRDGKRTVLAMQNAYRGPPEDFAMIVPVPVVLSEDQVKTLPSEVFTRVDKLAAPRLVEYWEADPCNPWVEQTKGIRLGGGGPAGILPEAVDEAGYGVVIEAQFTVAEYEIVILSALDSTGLDNWLRDNGYKIPAGAESLLRPYVQDGMKFFVAKVDIEKVKFERRPDGSQAATLSPLRFHYDSDQFSLPIRLGLINAPDGSPDGNGEGKGAQDLLVHVLARGQRYQVANYKNVTIPTNLDVEDSVRERFGEFYVSLFDHTLAQQPKAVVTEYAWAANSCDPCPEPALTLAELVTLGADALPSYAGKLDTQEIDPELEWSVPGEFVLTRLHARYDRSSLGEDLVFEEAPAIAGGRELSSRRSAADLSSRPPAADGMQTNGQLERGSQPSDENQFQARYAIRHPWTGKIDCEQPTRGVWGGPPENRDQEPQPTVARQLATAPRGGNLAGFVSAEAGAQLGISALEQPPADPQPPDQEPSSKTDAKANDGKGCRCAIDHEPTGTGFGLALLSLLALLGVRRKRA